MMTERGVACVTGTDSQTLSTSASNPRADRSGATPCPTASMATSSPLPSAVRVTAPGSGPVVSTETLYTSASATRASRAAVGCLNGLWTPNPGSAPGLPLMGAGTGRSGVSYATAMYVRGCAAFGTWPWPLVWAHRSPAKVGTNGVVAVPLPRGLLYTVPLPFELSCTKRNGKWRSVCPAVPSYQPARQASTICGKVQLYPPTPAGCELSDSPWYQMAPAIVVLRSGRIMPLYILPSEVASMPHRRSPAAVLQASSGEPDQHDSTSPIGRPRPAAASPS
mmetsp:Transcript_15389/g.45733  ORF Transcript_15389/g.45733 Transcript_15389/m.45733 type:complete len:279 (-) Transcript_15389:1300-2136(-)